MYCKQNSDCGMRRQRNDDDDEGGRREICVWGIVLFFTFDNKEEMFIRSAHTIHYWIHNLAQQHLARAPHYPLAWKSPLFRKFSVSTSTQMSFPILFCIYYYRENMNIQKTCTMLSLSLPLSTPTRQQRRSPSASHSPQFPFSSLSLSLTHSLIYKYILLVSSSSSFFRFYVTL
jgi:hypothetical protein